MTFSSTQTSKLPLRHCLHWKTFWVDLSHFEDLACFGMTFGLTAVLIVVVHFHSLQLFAWSSFELSPWNEVVWNRSGWSGYVGGALARDRYYEGTDWLDGFDYFDPDTISDSRRRQRIWKLKGLVISCSSMRKT